MRLLLLGGTRFLGRAVVASALGRGHQVTLFHRGRTEPGLFPECERVLGDRDGGLDALDGRTWDAVVDTCGFLPRIVAASARFLAGRAGHYTFVSSISVYASPIPPGADESAPVARLADPASEAMTGENYGALKALCELEVEAAFPGRALQVRAGLLVGPWDYTDRFGYWVRRYAEGGEVLVPDLPAQPVQWIDVRDVAEWVVASIESRTAGTFNVTGPEAAESLGGFLARIRAAVGGSVTEIPVSSEFLVAQGVVPWMELPIWAPDGADFLSMRIGRALAAGLRLRPLERTAHDMLEWFRGEGKDARPSTLGAGPPQASLTRERERALLEAWQARTA